MYSIYAGGELLYSDVYPNNSRKVASPTLKMVVDGAGSLEFTISEVNKCYTKLQRMKTIVTVKKFDIPIWDGRVVEETRAFNKNKKMYVEGALAFLNDTTQPIKEYKNKSLENLVTAILSEHNKFVLNSGKEIYWGGVADDFVPDEIEYWATAYEYTIEAIKKVAEYLECHYIIKKVETAPNSGVYVNKIFFFKEYYSKTNQSITFGKNLLDYTEQYDLSKLATVLLPLAKTDRESADEPNIVGTSVNLSTEMSYDDDLHYGVFMPLTHGVALQKLLGDNHKPYRDKLNLLLDVNTDTGTYTVKGVDAIATKVANSSVEWTIPDYVRVWKYDDGTLRDTIEDARSALLNQDFISGRTFSFLGFPNAAMRNFTDYFSYDLDASFVNDYTLYAKNGGIYRNFAESDSVAFKTSIEKYDGILTTEYSDYSVCILELDISFYRTLYLTTSGPTNALVTMSLWTRNSSSDNTPAYTKKAPVKLRYPGEGYIYLIYVYNEHYHEGGPDPQYLDRYYPAFAWTIGYTFPENTDHTVANLVEDDDLLPYVLDPDRYSCVKEYDIGACFSRKIDLNYTPPEGTSNKVLLAICGSGPVDVTLVSENDKLVDSTIAIGMNTKGIDVSQIYPNRVYSDHNTWSGGFGPGVIYVETANLSPQYYLPYAGYGVLTKLTDGIRLLTEQELESINYNAHLNIYNDGTINTNSNITNSIMKAVSPQERADYEQFKCCAITVRASYIDSNGKQFPNSIYLSGEFFGKTAMYAIFEFTDGNGGSGYANPADLYTAWDIVGTPKPSNNRTLLRKPLEFGKYIQGLTKLDGKKITMPYSNDQKRLLIVVIGTYGSGPTIHAHDPKLEDTVRYLTIASVNNGDTKLKADDSNIFGTNFEWGDISDQNGERSNVSTDTRIRTVEDVEVPYDGPYALSFEGNDLYVKAFIYGSIDGYSGVTAWEHPNPYIILPYLYKDYRLRLLIKKGSEGTALVHTNDITNVMIWSPENSRNMLFTQGKMIHGSNDESIDVDSTDMSRITTSDYYYVKDINCDIDIRLDMDTASMANSYNDGTNTCPITSRSIYILAWYQKPTVTEDEYGQKIIAYNSIVDTLPYVGPTDRTRINGFSENDRIKVELKMSISYVDPDDNTTKVVNDIDILPSYVRTFSITPITKKTKEYVVSNKAYKTYGYIEKRVEFDDINSSQDLYDRAKKYLNASQFDEMTLKIKAIDMSSMGVDTDSLNIADSIGVSSPPHGLYKTFINSSMSIPFDKISDTTFELGFDNKDRLSKLIQKENSKW